ncbi:MAG TPA: 50S ribosomal protein L5 [Candidatus Thermoplasmatota archaeon]|nr:50S ribosomal protein L5 [Candidatus Thermoplasmatota archaeon]
MSKAEAVPAPPAAAAKPSAPKAPTAPAQAAKPAALVPAAKPASKAPKAPAAKPARPASTNPMSAPRIAKVTINIGVGEGGEKLQKAEKVLQKLTGHKPLRTLGKELNRELGVRLGEPIGCKVTLRGDDADAFVKRALYTRKNKVYEYSFDNQGNLQFGVPDYTNFEGERYDPDVGVFGMDVCITLEKPGFRIKRRRIMARRVSTHHRVSREEAKAFLSKKFDLEVV